jgi:AraC family transcriptional regulator
MPPPAHRYGSLAEVYGSGGYAPFTNALRLAGTAPATLIRFSQPAGQFPDPPTDDVTLAINESGSGVMEFDMGAGCRQLPFRVGDLVLKPPGVATRFANSRPHAKSFVSLPPSFLAEAAGAPPDFGRLHADAFRCPVLARLLEMLWVDPSLQSPQGRLFADGLLLALTGRLLSLAQARLPEPGRGALSPERLERVDEWVAAHLAEPFGLDEMAASVGLSPFHFARSFKQATGETPLAFVAAKRIELAKRLLGAGATPLAEVAQLCGFADQAHFTTAFRHRTGMTPGVWRRAAR